ncbi:MAG TPA: sugar ABC transporter permease [Roseiflexaceae bacterium]|jgi:multiple sugar transport system permease protein|nr:sugar ABC transporter permease [Roseiflexaceae bacterium]
MSRTLQSPVARREAIYGYLFIAPAVLGFLIWIAGPMLFSAWVSLTEWDLLSDPEFVGLSNYQSMFQDPLFWQSLKVTAYFTLVSVPLFQALALAVALLMNTNVRGISFFRTIYYLPSIVPVVANAMLWSWVFNSEFGLLNAGLRAIGLPKILWLQNPNWAMPALITMSLWGLGGAMLIYLAGLQGVPQQLYEAAELDGASYWHRFRHVTIPMISPVLFFNLLMGLIGALQTFTQGYIITNGGPQNSTLFYALYIYRRAFTDFKMGYAAALAWVLFVIVLVLSVLVFRYLGRQVYYEDEGR